LTSVSDVTVGNLHFLNFLRWLPWACSFSHWDVYTPNC